MQCVAGRGPGTKKGIRYSEVQHDEVDAAAFTTAYGPSVVVDETHAGFGVVKDTKALTLSTISGVRLAKRMGRHRLFAREVGDVFTPRKGA